ncbi:MAG TPA: HAMP domain-containing sensor histidine kinase [Thermoanaerobaculia bacterium]|jgi:signal transduction histidine kinase|nr:HAMP domain-containing sensor histidine kinase [Thermoanaerobaculia bacterium]
MSWRASLATFALLGTAALILFHLFQREITGSWLAFGVHPQVLAELESSLADQKRLARTEPEREKEYRQRFGRIEALLSHLRVLALSRGEIARRYEMALSGLLVAVLAAVAGAHAWRQAREGRRLERLRAALGDLAAGRTDLAVGVSGRDPVGRVAGMVEEASRTMAKDRRRIASLENLSAWQEAARRHAHEMRTPLTAARLELDHLGRLVAEPEAAHLVASVEQEIDRLERFTHSFATFARLPRPTPRIEDLGALAAEFVELFGSAWPNLALRAERPEKIVAAAVDREMIRQVWVNLVENAANACAGRRGTVTLVAGEGPMGPYVEVADDGPGIAPEILPRLFEPYVSGRPGGGGMGLGLAISRKILLDHGGDLELVESGPRGARFRLVLPRLEGAG